jgi:hypothetical protein
MKDNSIRKFDKFGNLVYIELDTGFKEEIEYTPDGKYITKIDTLYPNGIRETEHFNPINRKS